MSIRARPVRRARNEPAPIGQIRRLTLTSARFAPIVSALRWRTHVYCEEKGCEVRERDCRPRRKARDAAARRREPRRTSRSLGQARSDRCSSRRARARGCSTATRHRRNWRIDGPHFLGHIIQHVVLDPRDGRTLLAAAKTGHLGPTVFRSTDLGKTWKEAQQPPAFAKTRRRQGSSRRSHLLADTGTRERARGLVCRHIAAGTVPQRRRRCHLARRLADQR